VRNPPSSSSPSNRQNGSKRDSGSSRGIASAGTSQPGLGSEGHDIPVARRSQLIKPQRRFRFRQSLLTATLLLAGTASLIWLFRDPIQRQLAPPPVRGLNVRQGLDGRLLGHFPYPEAPSSDLVDAAPGIALHRDAAEKFLAMQRDAAADGVSLRLLSGFRSIALQKHLFFDVGSQRNQSAEQRARVSAPPGFSEHSTGYALDIGDGQRAGTNLSQSFEATPAFAWLVQNANRYHFGLSFPAGNTQGVNYEPWHWRFEGSAEALTLFEPAHRLTP